MMRTRWRVAYWSCGATLAVAAVLFAGYRAFNDETESSAASIVVAVPQDSNPGQPAQKLAHADVLHDLIADHDRLVRRVATLERARAEVTGSIDAVHAEAPAGIDTKIDMMPPEPPSVPVKFAIDLGAASSMDMMRAQWAVAKANYAKLLAGLHPLAGIEETRPGAPELRLIVGPLDDIKSAAALCAKLAGLHSYCRTAIFNGRELALAEPAPAAAPPEQAETAIDPAMTAETTPAPAKAVEAAPAKSETDKNTAAPVDAPKTASACAGDPDALGTSRVLAVSAEEFSGIGTMQYKRTLPLADHEVVLTFDDGPLPPYTNHVLAVLAAECVKATFFMVGQMARAYPDVARLVHAGGHTIGSHSEHHPYNFASMSMAQVAREINEGIVSIGAALGEHDAVAPFFRFPGLIHVRSAENYLRTHAIVSWSADIVGDDWTRISANEILRRLMSRLEAKGRGIILLHDIHPATALMLPALLKSLKTRGYRIVQVVPKGGHPKAVPVASTALGKR